MNWLKVFVVSSCVILTGHAYISEIDWFINKVGTPRVLTSYKKTGQAVEVQTSTYPIRVDVLADDLVKIRYATDPTFRDEYTYSITPETKWAAVPYSVDATADGGILIKAKNIQVRITKNPVLVSVLDRAGAPLLENRGTFADKQDDFLHVDPPKVTVQHRVILGTSFKMQDADHFYGLGEKFRGPGDQSLDWRGRKRDSYTAGTETLAFGNTFEGADGGANGNVMVPYLLNPRGYAVYFDTVYKSYWEFDSPARDAWFIKADCDMDWQAGFPRCERSELRFYVSASKSMARQFYLYTQLTGKPIMPPRWMLGFLQSKYGYENWGQVHAIAKKMHDMGFPLDALFLDLQWFGGVPGVHDENFDVDAANKPGAPYNNCDHRRVGSFKFFRNEFDFSNPSENMALLKKQGISVVPIEEGYFDSCSMSDNSNYSDARDRGFLARTDFGSLNPALYANGDDKLDGTLGRIGYFGQVGMIDTANADARKWFWEKHLEVLRLGAATFWTDLGEPERFRWWWKYANNLWHQDIHNVWDLNRARALFEGSKADLPDRRNFIMSRSGYAGSQRYGVGIWAADTPARLHWARSQPAAHLGLSISGIPYTTSDIGGFGGLPPSSPAQYTRWLQMESFSSLTRAHGNTTVGAQWARIVHPCDFPEPFATINKRYLLWRESLVPYLYTHAHEAYETGMPILRALPIIYPDDPQVTDLGSEYLFGPNILVAPMLEGNEGSPNEMRDIYLPAGAWFDMHDGTRLKGGEWHRNFKSPLKKMPLFAREGAIIPRALTLQNLSDPAYDTTRIVEIYPSSRESVYVLYDDDGLTNKYQSQQGSKTDIHVIPKSATEVAVTVSPMRGTYQVAARAYQLELHAESKPVGVNVDGAELPITSLDIGEDDPLPETSTAARALYVTSRKKLLIFTPSVPAKTARSWNIKY